MLSKTGLKHSIG